MKGRNLRVALATAAVILLIAGAWSVYVATRPSRYTSGGGTANQYSPSTPSPTSQLPQAPASGRPEPPPASINGVAGALSTRCWAGRCVDGMLRGPLLGGAQPFRLTLTAGTIKDAQALDVGAHQLAMDLKVTNGLIEPVPEGLGWLVVHVVFDARQDTLYIWRLK